MMKTIAFFLAVCAMMILPVAGVDEPAGRGVVRRMLTDSKLIVQVDTVDITPENRSEILSRVRKSGADGLELAFPEFFAGGEKRRRAMDELAFNIRYFEDAGLAVGVWISTLGYWAAREGDFAKRFPGARRLKSFKGVEAAYCATCPQTLAAAQENVREIARAGAKLILLDDDLVQCCRPGIGCVCDEHLRRFAMKLGRPSVSVDEIVASLTGPSNAVRTAFYDVMGDSLREFCRSLRAAADAVDPSVNLGLCASISHYDMDGAGMDEILGILTAKGAKPFLRASGATYWPIRPRGNPRNFGQGLGGVAEFVRYQASLFRGHDMLFCDENDTHPRSTEVVPTGMCEVYDKVMLAEGVVRNKYILRHDSKAYPYVPPTDPKAVNFDPGYLSAHVANLFADREIAVLFRGARPFGFRVYRPVCLVREAEMPKEYLGDNAMIKYYSQPLAGIYLTANGAPTQYDRDDLPGAAFGWEAVKVPASAYARGLVLDREGAEALVKRGVDVGLGKAAKRVGEWSLYANAQGGKFAVCDKTRHEISYEPEASRSFPANEIWRFFTGTDLPVRLEAGAGVYLLAKERPDGTFAVLVCNMRGEESGPIRVVAGGRSRSLTLAGWGFSYMKL